MQELQLMDNQVVARDIHIITTEIKDIFRQAQTMALVCAIEIGRRLKEAKDALQHGGWGDWLKNEVNFSQSTAVNFMRLYTEYGSNSQSIANLPYSKALQLLVIPKEEREAFAAEVDAENLSVKELKEALEQRDKAIKEAEEAKAREMDISLKLDLANKKEKELQELQAKYDNLRADFEKSKSASVELKEKLKRAEANPNVPKAVLEKIRKEASDAAQKEKNDETEKKLNDALERLKNAEKEAIALKLEAKQAAEKLNDVQSRMKTASPEITAFKTLFDDVQGTVCKLKNMISKIRETDSETADKLTAALKAFGASL